MYNYVYVLVCAYMCVCVCGLQSRDGMVEGWVVLGFVWYCMEWSSMGWYIVGWVVCNEKQSKEWMGCYIEFNVLNCTEFNGMVH